jgi:subtilase family serine protease
VTADTTAVRSRVAAIVVLGVLGWVPGVAAATTLRHVQPAPRAIAGARDVGAAARDATLRLEVALAPRDPEGLDAFVAAVSTPGSALYRRFLAPGAFARRFGPASSAIAAVRGALRAAGLAPGATSDGGLFMSVRGTVAQVEAALHTPIRSYRLRSGATALANTAAPALPATVAGEVTSIVGLDTRARAVPLGLRRTTHTRATSSGPLRARRRTPRRVRRAIAPRARAAIAGGPNACAEASDAAASYGAWTADQLATAYDFNGLYTAGASGAGTTIGVYALEPYTASDIAQYASCYGTSGAVTDVEVDGGASGIQQGESALDIETVLGLAPHANVRVYLGQNGGGGLLDLWQAIASEDAAQVVTTSWGLCEPDIGAADAAAEGIVFAQMAAQGQTVFAASGDSGSEGCGSSALAVDDPAAQRYVTGVGGTTLTALGAPGTAPTEWTWSDTTSSYGSGGGISTLTPMPTYQSGVIGASSSAVPCGASSGDCREVPDVSASADPQYGYVTYWDQQNGYSPWTAFGGTSAAAPLWAALAATIDSTSTCAAHPVGFLNPALYRIAAASSADFNDITFGDNDVTGTNNGAYPASTGYDMATGLGTPAGTQLATDLCNSEPPPSSTPPPTPTPTPTTPPAGSPPTSSGASPAPSGSTSSTTTSPLPPNPPLPHANRTTRVTLGRLPHGGLSVTPGGLLRLPLACPAVLDGCRASIALSLPTSHTHPHAITLATLSARRLTPGAHVAITLHLSHARLTALEHRHSRRVKLRLRITGTFEDGIRTSRTMTVLVRLPSNGH